MPVASYDLPWMDLEGHDTCLPACLENISYMPGPDSALPSTLPVHSNETLLWDSGTNGE